MYNLLRSMDISQRFRFGKLRLVGMLLALVALGACSSTATMEAEQAAMDQQRVAAEQEAARVAAEEARQQAAAEELQRQARVEEQQRIEADRRQQAELARREAEARAEQERQQRQQREQARLREEQRQREAENLARAERERDEKLARIAELEAQIADMQTNVAATDEANALYQEAILVAEELVNVLAAEQSKYDNVDTQGNLAEPLAKDLIAELEGRKNSLVREAEAAR